MVLPGFVLTFDKYNVELIRKVILRCLSGILVVLGYIEVYTVTNYILNIFDYIIHSMKLNSGIDQNKVKLSK